LEDRPRIFATFVSMAKVEAGLILLIALPKYQRKGVAERF
jgi:hypothetical protein